MLGRGYQAVNYVNARQISDFYVVSDIFEIITPKAFQCPIYVYVYILIIKLNRRNF